MSDPENRLPVASPVLGDREVEYVTDAVRSGWVSNGPYVKRFEEGFAAFVGARHAISASNGTTALHLALHALRIGPGDEVIVPDLTFAATAHSVLQTGAVPVLADVEPDTWCVDPEAVRRALSPRTRAIIPVHLYGHPADMTALGALAAPRGIHLVEDCAESHGATIEGRATGSIGAVGTFSFYGNKLITTGEGGMLTTSDDALAARIRFLKDHGMSPARRYYHTELAFNYRMTNIQAALGVAQLERIDDFIERRRRIFAWYKARLGGVAGLTLNAERPGYKNVFWMSCVVIEPSRAARDEVAEKLGQRGIETRPFFVAMADLPHLGGLRRAGRASDDCPVSARLSRTGLNLPSGGDLREEDVDRVCRALLSAIGAT